MVFKDLKMKSGSHLWSALSHIRYCSIGVGVRNYGTPGNWSLRSSVSLGSIGFLLEGVGHIQVSPALGVLELKK